MTLDQCYQTNTKSIKIQAGSVNYPNVIDELILKLQTKRQISLNKGGKTSPTRHQNRNGERTMARVQKLTGDQWNRMGNSGGVRECGDAPRWSTGLRPKQTFCEAAIVGSRLNPSVMGMLAAKPKSDILNLIPRPTL